MDLPAHEQYQMTEAVATQKGLSVARLFKGFKQANPFADSLLAEAETIYDNYNEDTHFVVTNMTENESVTTPNELTTNEDTHFVVTNVLEDTPQSEVNTDFVVTNVNNDDESIVTDVVTPNELTIQDLHIKEYLNVLKKLKQDCQVEFGNLRAEKGNKTTVLDRLKRKAIEFRDKLKKYESSLNQEQLDTFNAFLDELKSYPIGL